MTPRTSFMTLILAIVSSLASRDAFADIVLTPIGNISWDRMAFPAASPEFLVSVSVDGNNVGGNDLNAFSVALRFVPTAGATGSIQIGTVSQAPVNSIFPTVNPLSVTQPVPDVFAINGTNSVATDVLVTAPRNLVSVNFSSPNNANGTFQIFAVPEFTSYFDTAEFDGFKFTNVPPGDNVLVGTLNVTAVPEPTSLAFAGVAACCFFAFRRRKVLESIAT